MKQSSGVLAFFLMTLPGLAGAQASMKAPGRLAPLELKGSLSPAATAQFQLGAPRSLAMKPGLTGPSAMTSLGSLRAAMTQPLAPAGLGQLFDGQAGGKTSEPVAATKEPKFPRGEWYVSWGYPRSLFTRSDIRFIRPSMGDDFTFHKVKAHDEPEWDTGIFNKPLTVPEYNFRLGYFFNKKKDLALEVNFDHVKYTVDEDQDVRMTGKFGGAPVDQQIKLTEDVLDYELCDGANFLLINVVKRLPIIGKPGETLSVAGIAKAGAGIVIPDPENSVFGLANAHNSGKKGYQIAGWNTGIEAGFRFVPLKPFYLELTNKLDFADYTGVNIAHGKAKQSFWTYEAILSLGVTIDASPKKKP